MAIKVATADRVETLQDPKAREQRELDAEGDRLYDTYVKPLEQEHWGRFVAVSRNGQILLGDDLYDVVNRAEGAFGRGNFVYKVGEVVVGTFR